MEQSGKATERGSNHPCLMLPSRGKIIYAVEKFEKRAQTRRDKRAKSSESRNAPRVLEDAEEKEASLQMERKSENSLEARESGNPSH